MKTWASAMLIAGTALGLTACGGGDDSENPRSDHLFYQQRAFDLQAHRGGLGLEVESSEASFSNALQMGVSTLELDTQITKDGVAVVTHDRKVSKSKCQDTAPASADDPLFPYVGRYIKDLTLAQVKTMDCGSLRLSNYPQQNLSPGAKMLTLRELLDLVKSYRADQVLLNVETKVEAGAPQETAPREQFVQVVLDEIRRAGMLRQTTIQSFDWGALMLVRKLEPSLPIVALTNGQQFLQAGKEGASPWLGGLDIDDFQGDLVAAARSFGADAISPVHGDPQGGHYGDANYKPYTTPDLVRRAHAVGIQVIPWTVSDESTMKYLIDAKVDGFITDLPDVARSVLQANGLSLPQPVAKQ